ncbi:MAG: cation diffusion facilitator family transporter [Candidatus Bathyarchaeia archaeon]|jgi:cation diffusion facilitator family transporter
MQGSKDDRYKLNALKWSAIAISSVVIIEVIIGILVNSLAVLSDGLHATLDVLSSVMLFYAAKTAIKPPDEEHRYGHEKFEAIGGLIAGIILIGVALLIFYEAGIRLIEGVQFKQGLEFAGFIAIGYTLSIDVVRLVIFRKAQGIEGASIKAGFYDALSDFGSTIIALIGFGLATIGIFGSDSFASIFLGAMLCFLSFRLVRSSINELSDTASKDMVQKAQELILSCTGVVSSDNLKVRKAGSKVFVDATVQVPKQMSLEEAHALASKIEQCLKDGFGNVDATIHIEPCEKETELNLLVEKLATIEGVQQVHEISTVYFNGKLFITLHAFVEPKLSVEEAHVIAEKIEVRMHQGIKALENVTVHVEPAGTTLPENLINDEQLRKVVTEAAKSISPKLKMQNIVSYVSEGKRYINIDCCFTKQVKITEAHKIASQVEKEIKEHFASAVVTIHIEPDCST